MQLATDNQGQQEQQTQSTVSTLVVTTVGGGGVRLIIFSRKVNPTLLHIPCVKATFVNGSGAAELSHFRVGAAEPRELEGMQAGEREGGRVSEGVGGKNRETAKTRQGMRRGGEGEGERDTDRRTAGELERGRNRKAGPSIGWDNFPLIAGLFGDCWRKVYCPHAAAGEEAIK